MQNQKFTPVPIPKDGSVFITKQIQFSKSMDDIFLELKLETLWCQNSINMYGKDILEPRLTAWYGDPHAVYTYSGIKNIPLSWTDTLFNMKQVLEQEIGTEFNSVLLNYYRNGNDYMGFHSDDELELGLNPVIASVSLGSARKFLFINKANRKNEVPVVLNHGDVLVMAGDTQTYWKHGIRKTLSVGPRINLTFRKVY